MLYALVLAADLLSFPTPEAQFRAWYSGTEDRVRLETHPDDTAALCYDYRAFHASLLRGEVRIPKEGEAFPAKYRLCRKAR